MSFAARMLLNPFLFGGTSPQVPATPAVEPTFKNVVLLVDGQGTNGSTAVTDGSLHQLVPTAADATIAYDASTTRFGTASLYSSAGNGLKYQTLNDHQALFQGTADWTVELSVKLDNIASNFTFFSLCQAEAAGRYAFYYDATARTILLNRYAAPNSSQFGGTGLIAANTWYDVAVTRQGGTVSFYLNGVLLGTTTGDTGLSYAGAVMNNNTGGIILGGGPAFHLANVRVTRGVARAIAPLTQVFNTVYDPTSLSLPLESAPQFFANSSVVDDTGIHSQGSVPSNASVSTDPTYAYFGRSGAFFNNAGLSLNTVYTEQLDGMDWTISLAVFLTAAPSTAAGGIMGLLSTFLNNAGWRLFIDSNRQLTFQSQLTDGTLWGTAPVRSLQTNRWHYIVATRKGQLVSLFANGLPMGFGLLPLPTTRFKDSVSAVVNVGMEQGNTWYLTGYADTVRIKVGSGDYVHKWPANPTASYPVDRTGDRYMDDVALLVAGDLFVDLSMRPKSLTITGVSVSNTAVQKFGKNMMYFTAGTYISVAVGSEMAFGTGDFALEFDYYSQNDAVSNNALLCSRSATGDAGFTIDVIPTGLTFTPIGGGTGFFMTVPTATLCHIVIERRGGVFFGYVDGVLAGWLNAAAQSITYSGTFLIGKYNWLPAVFKGYVGNLRITANRARVFPAKIASVPTKAQAKTYARLDPYDCATTSAALSAFNLGFAGSNAARATVGLSTGKWYWEISSNGSRYPIVGVGTADASVETAGGNQFPGLDANGWGYYGLAGKVINGGTQTLYGTVWNNTAHVVGVYLDCDAGTLGFIKNGVDMGLAFSGLQGKTLYPMVGGDTGSGTSQATFNFGLSPFVNTPPAGYNKGVYQTVVEDVPTYSDVDDTEYHAGFKLLGDATAFQKSVVWDRGRYAFMQNDGFANVCQYTGKIVKSGTTSLYVPNTGTLLKYPSDAAFNMNIPRWTWRCWAYELPASLGSLLCRRTNTSNATGWVWTTSYLRAKLNGVWSDSYVPITRPAFNTWNHYELVKDGTTLYHFVNGVLIQAMTLTTWDADLAVDLVIGCADSASENRFQGYLNDLEFIPGVALHSASFPPPTAAYPNDSVGDPYFANVELLLHADGANGSTTAADSSSRARTATGFGTASISSGPTKFGKGSLLLPGGVASTWDIADDPAWFLGAGDFTLECWSYMTSSGYSTYRQFMGQRTGASTGWTFAQANGTIYLWVDAVLYGQPAIPAGYLDSWHHYALMRRGNTLYYFYDGMCIGAAAAPANMPDYAVQLQLGGPTTGGQTGNFFSGYLDDVRITKGVARYSPAGFAPPTRPATVYPDPKLLTYRAPLKFWLDASDATSLNVTGTVVNSWTDKVGGVVFSAGAGSAAVNVNSALMALPCVDFGMALRAWLESTTGVTFRRICTIFVVGYWNNDGGQYRSIALQSNANNNAQQGGTGTPDLSIYTATSGPASAQLAGATISTYIYDASMPIAKASNFLVEVSGEATVSATGLLINGVSNKSTAGTALPEHMTYKVIGNTDNLYLSNGAFGEVRIYDGFLTPQEKAKIRTELSAKWKLGS